MEVIDGNITLGVLVAFQGLMMQFLNPIREMLSNFADIQETQGNIDRIDDIFSQPEISQPKEDDHSQNAKPISFPLLELKNVTFGYQRLQPPLLKDFNLTVGPGKWAAFVGASGSGKSTVTRLLSQLYKPWSGSIELGGIPIDQIDAKDFANVISFIDQKIVLFNATIAENLSLWNSTITFDQLTKAAKIACIHDWIINRPTGYDHKISEDGSNISGGEKARIEIARALAVEPSLIVLDEATAGLDPETEHKLLRSIRQNCAGGIIISHKIEPIKLCDEIIVFEGGKVVQRGNHNDLIAQENGLYGKLFSIESS